MYITPNVSSHFNSGHYDANLTVIFLHVIIGDEDVHFHSAQLDFLVTLMLAEGIWQPYLLKWPLPLSGLCYDLILSVSSLNEVCAPKGHLGYNKVVGWGEFNSKSVALQHPLDVYTHSKYSWELICETTNYSCVLGEFRKCYRRLRIKAVVRLLCLTARSIFSTYRGSEFLSHADQNSMHDQSKGRLFWHCNHDHICIFCGLAFNLSLSEGYQILD